MSVVAHPYQGADFWSFFVRLFSRMARLLSGHISWQELATDEIQIFVLLGVAMSAALVGCLLVLRRMTMMANSLSHTVLLGVVVAYVFFYGTTSGGYQTLPIGASFLAALISGCLTVLLTEFLVRVARVREDAANGLVFSTLFALGVLLATALTRNSHVGIETVMGSADALHRSDIGLAASIFGLNVSLVCLFYKEFQCSAFDYGFARAAGLPTRLVGLLLMLQLSVTAIGAFRAVGVVLVLAFIVAPALFGRLFARSLAQMLCLAASAAGVSVLIGVALARHCLSRWGMPLSTAGLVTCVLALIYVGGLLVRGLRLRLPIYSRPRLDLESEEVV